MLPTFWHVLNRFWIGAVASDAFRNIVYFGGQGVRTDVFKLLGWFAVGVILLALGWFKLQRGREEVTSGHPAVTALCRSSLAVRVADRGVQSW